MTGSRASSYRSGGDLDLLLGQLKNHLRTLELLVDTVGKSNDYIRGQVDSLNLVIQMAEALRGLPEGRADEQD